MKQRPNDWLSIAIVVVILAAMAAGVALYKGGSESPEAHAKAREFISKLQAAGYRAPREAAVVRLFGTEGGPATEHPWAALLKAQYFAQFGTAGPASRPVILSPRFIEAARIFLSVYEPEKLPAFDQYVRGLKLGNTVKDQ